MNSTISETVEFNLSINGVHFSVKGPRDWADDRITIMLAKSAFSLDGQQSIRKLNATEIEASADEELAIHLRRWLHRHSVTWEELLQVVHIEPGRSEVITNNLPGNAKEKVIAAYLLEGIACYAIDEHACFQDKDARALLVKHDAYDKGNHSYYVKGLKGKVIGDKNDGWKLSVPGHLEAAKLIKTIAKGAAHSE